jgi:hypothetical protein
MPKKDVVVQRMNTSSKCSNSRAKAEDRSYIRYPGERIQLSNYLVKCGAILVTISRITTKYPWFL